MQHEITEKLFEYTDKLCYNKLSAEQTQALAVSAAQQVSEKVSENILRETSDGFKIRMSAIGKPLRQLLLEQKYGRGPMTRDMYFKMQLGHMAEAMLVAHMEQAGIPIGEKNKKVELALPKHNTTIGGEYDLDIDGIIWDVKTASDFSYNKKFESWQTLMDSDDFGYMAQGFGYSEAANKPFGGWIVINKNNSEIKVVPIPQKEHKWLRERYIKEINNKVDHLLNRPDDIPPCEGVVDEYFNRKATGNRIIGMKCRWCPFKDDVCHKGNISKVPCVNSKAKVKPIKEYIGDYK